MVCFPEGFHCEPLRRDHPRAKFGCGQAAVDDWLRKQAWQNQSKQLSVTRVLVEGERLAGYYTLAMGQVDFGDLPAELARKLPRRALPIAVVAWLGVDTRYQGRGLGERLFAQALADCHEAGRVFPFVTVLIDCLDDTAKAFYRRWDFQELPGRPLRLFLSARRLEKLMEG